MRLFFGEMNKVFRNRAAVLILICLLGVNGFFAYFSSQNGETFFGASAYRNIHKELAEKTYEEALAEVNERMELSEFSFEMSTGVSQESLKARYGERYNSLAEEYQDKKYVFYNDIPYFEWEMLKQVSGEYSVAGHYKEYLDKVQTSSKQMQLFAKRYHSNSFLYRNIIKTAEDFARIVPDNETVAGPNLGIEKALNCTVTDLLGTLFLFYTVLILIMREKETQQLLLMRSAARGRIPLGAAKTMATLATGVMTAVVLYVENLFVYGMIYGMGNLSRPIYTLLNYQTCKYAVSVLTYIGLFLLGKAFVYAGISLLFLFCAVLCKNAVSYFSIGGVCLGVEAILYLKLSNRGIGVLFKNVNVIAFLNTDSLLRDYRNLNLCEVPVNYQTLFWIVTALVTVAGFGLCVFSFAGMKNHTASPIKRFSLFGKFSFCNHGNLFLHECYKIFLRGGVLLFLAVYGFCILYFNKPIHRYFYDETDANYYFYMSQIEGTYTPEKEAWIETEEKRIQNEQMRIINGDGGTSSEIELQSLEKKTEALRMVQERLEYLKQKEGAAVVYERGYRMIYDDTFAQGKAWQMSLLISCMMILCLTCVYGVEYDTGMIVPIRTCIGGRTRTFACKLGISLIVSNFLFVLTYGLYFQNVFRCYGTEQIHEKAYSIPALQNYSCSILEYLLLMCMVRYLAMLLTMAIILLLSVKVKRMSFTVALGAALLVLPLLLGLLSVRSSEYILLNPFWFARLR